MPGAAWLTVHRETLAARFARRSRFTIAGFGNIVTGTLLDGYLNTGDEVLVLGMNKTN
jgi:selenocysteine-specific translation elongation factor